MTDGTSQGLFIVVAIVIFGIFAVLAYILFEDTLSPALANMFNTTSELTTKQLNKDFTGFNLLTNGSRMIEGPISGYSGSESQGKIPGVEGREYITHEDLTPIFDRFGLGTYTISFDLKATIPGKISVYTHDGGTKYLLSKDVTVNESDTWDRYSVVVKVSLLDKSSMNYSEKTNLSFYGTYGTRRSPSVRNIKVELGSVSGIPVYEEKPNHIRY